MIETLIIKMRYWHKNTLCL